MRKRRFNLVLSILLAMAMLLQPLTSLAEEVTETEKNENAQQVVEETQTPQEEPEKVVVPEEKELAPMSTDAYGAPGTKQKVKMVPKAEMPGDDGLMGVEYYYMTENGKEFPVYCFNFDKYWPYHEEDGNGGYKEDGIYVPDAHVHLPDDVKDKLYRVMYAGYPHNSMGFYEGDGLEDYGWFLDTLNAHSATQYAIWAILEENEIPGNMTAFSSPWFPEETLAGKLIAFANGVGDYANVNVPKRGLSYETMEKYRDEQFATGKVLLRADNTPVESSQIVFTMNDDGKYVSEPLHFSDDAYAMAYKVELKSGDTVITSTMNYGQDSFTLETDTKPTGGEISITSESNYPSDIYQYTKEDEAEKDVDDRDYQEMSGCYYNQVPMALTLGTKFLDADTTEVSVKKVWADHDNQDGLRASDVVVKLLAGGSETGLSLTLNKGNNWEGTFKDLPVKKGGNTIEYTVVEEEDVTGYTSSITGSATDGFVITNTHEVATTDISGTKEWNHGNNQNKPTSITIRLRANGEVIDTKEVTASNDWKWSFTNLPVNKDGNKIEYSVTEDTVPNYESHIDEETYKITNTYAPGKTSVEVEKSWVDGNDQDGKRPNDITVELYKDGDPTGTTVTLNANNHWAAAFEDLEAGPTYTVHEETVSGYQQPVVTGNPEEGFVITNTREPEKTSVSGHKVWNDNGDSDGKRPESITVKLHADGSVVDSQEVKASDNWEWTFTDLPKYKNGQLIVYTFTENTVDDYETSIQGSEITNTYAVGKTSVEVEKSWVDGGNRDHKRPSDVTVQLYKDGKATGNKLILNEGNDWAGVFEDLDKFKDGGTEIVYTVDEETVEGYHKVISGNQEEGFVITNSYTPETTSVSGSKTWNDNGDSDGKRPDSITIRLRANGKVVESKEVKASDEWKWNFTDLPKRENGELIEYTITEDVPEGYSAHVDGYDVTNTYQPGKTSVEVEKSWLDSDNQDGKRPNDLTVELYKDGTPTGKTITLSDGNNWQGTFENLEEYRDGGTKIVYTVEEEEVKGYSKVISGDATTGFVITNSYTTETTSVSGSKTWENDSEGVRPDSITIRLHANDKEVDHKVVDATVGWKWNFTDLPKYANGQLINYSITEDNAENYASDISGFDVTNTYKPGVTQVEVSKVWADDNNRDGKRPSDLTVELYADGEPTGKTLILNEVNNWAGVFKDLDDKKNDTKIVYTVEEEEVKGYNKVITGNATTGFVITNSYTPETTSVSGSKTWKDNDDQDGIRPESIIIRLHQNGKVIDEKTVTEENEWKWHFTGLPKYEKGTLINYSITEDVTKEYSTEIKGFDLENTYVPKQTSISVSKGWQDSNDQDGIRPESVTLRLYANGDPTDKTVVLNDGNNWTETFQNLDVNKSGNKITYEVKEESVPTGYHVVMTGNTTAGFVFTNSHTPEVIDIEGSKTWDDNDDNDHKRPESITIRLHADGEVVDTKVVTAADDWSWKFEGVPKCAAGQPIAYTVTEDTVGDYTAEVDEFDVTNSREDDVTDITVSKSWQDGNNQDGIRANDVTVVLVKNGQDTNKEAVLNEGNRWLHTFRELPKNEGGQEIVYTVREKDEVTGYHSSTTGNATEGYVITNSHTPEEIDIEGSKTWNDKDNQDGKRPSSILVRLRADGIAIDEKVVTEADDWSWKFENLPKYSAGTEIVYTVTEDTVTNYTTDYEDYNVKNSYTPSKISINVNKSWQDADDQDGKRANSVHVKLLADGKATNKKIELSADNNWQGTFTDLDEYKKGVKIDYTIVEEEIDDYESVVSGNMTEGFLVTNSHTPETISVEGSKIWKDKNNQDGVRPESITIRLHANGTEIDEKVVTEADEWKWSFTDLPKYEAGEEIVYSVTEDAIADYTATIKGYNIVNEHITGVTSVSVSKSWKDSNNYDKKRPGKVVVELLANGEKTGKKLTLKKRNHWTGTFGKLDLMKDGKEIVYTVKEVDVKGYKSTVSGNMKKGFVITNSHTSKKLISSRVKTGDSSSVLRWMVLLLVSLIVAFVAMVQRTRRGRRRIRARR